LRLSVPKGDCGCRTDPANRLYACTTGGPRSRFESKRNLFRQEASAYVTTSVLVGRSVCYPDKRISRILDFSEQGYDMASFEPVPSAGVAFTRWRKRRAQAVQPNPNAAVGSQSVNSKRQSKSGRESIESFVVVFLAFLVWSLEAEGFVVPTGSMAPTLMGRHKEIVCPQCGYRYTVNADREVEISGARRRAGERVALGTCENCRYDCQVADAPSFSGDRIYVMKDGVSLPFFQAAGKIKLNRWDVTVFKLPEEPEVRYIKRLVGMPNEVIRIAGGDLWFRPLSGERGFERLRRPLDHQQAMQLTVYDDSHRPAALRDDPRWRRWVPGRAGDWSEPAPGAFVPTARGKEWAELHYQHVVPGQDDWKAVRAGAPAPGPPRPMLITDYSSYNTDLSPADRFSARFAARPWFQPHWVGDLTLSLRLQVQKPEGIVQLELYKGGKSNRCEIDLAAGKASLYHEQETLAREVPTPVVKPGAYDLVLANVDDRLTLWVNGALPFGAGHAYESGPRNVPTADDLRPARIRARNATVQVANLVLKRDIYYTLDPAEADYANVSPEDVSASQLDEILSDPARFAMLVHRPAKEYPIRAGRYLMLGDNSPWSRDGRAWGPSTGNGRTSPAFPADDAAPASWEVPESLLIGKAFCVYWPHPKPVWPALRFSTDIRLPILPYIEQMRLIR
jgi:signal peptidase I